MKIRRLKVLPIPAAMAGAFAALFVLASPVVAQTNEELRREIAEQRLRLEALERKLSAVPAAPQAPSTATPAPFNETARREGAGIGYHDGRTDVDLYGLLDIALSNMSNANAAGKSLTSFQTPWFSGPRWGVIGRRKLADGAPDLIFKLESEFLLQTGEMDTPGVLFNRDAWVGFQGDGLGKLTFGRQNTLARDFSQNYGDPYNRRGNVGLDEGGWTNTNNFKQLIFYAGSVTGTRYDRGVVWKKEFGNLVGGLGYQFGGVPGQFSQGSTQSAALAYNADVFNVSGFVNHANVNTFSHSTYSVGGNVKVGPITRVYGGYFHYKADQPAPLAQRTDKAWPISVRFSPPGKLDYELGYARFNANNAGLTSKGFILTPYNDTSAAKLVGTGTKSTIYGSIFYHIDRGTELYLAADYMKTTNGYKDSRANGFMNQREVAMGLRTWF